MSAAPEWSPVEQFLAENLWAIIMVVAGLIVWGIRLEGRVTGTQRDLSQNYTTRVETAELHGKVESQNRALTTLGETMSRVEKKVDQLLMTSHDDR